MGIEGIMKHRLQRKPWQGVAAKADNEKELIATCGCIFRATGGYWIRIVDCPKHILLSILSY